MSDRRTITCSACNGEVIPGMLYCWRHPSNPPKIGQLLEDHGQLLWQATAACSGKLERAIAVLLDGIQVEVRVADERVRPAQVNLEIGNPADTAPGTTSVFLPLTCVLDALLAGDEQVEASRFA